MKRYLTAILLTPSLAAEVAAFEVAVNVQVYNWANAPAATLDQAAKVLGKIFRVSGLESRWTVGSLDTLEARHVVLVDPPRPGRERHAACAARSDIALAILDDSAGKLKSGTLGSAEPFAPAGINATVFLGRIADASDEHGVPLPVLLGHAIAHEIGHVLLRSVGHRKGGLMSSGWNEIEFRMIRSSGLFFDSKDARFIRAAIQREGCDRVTAK
jgi:hypothetical protein